MASLSEFHDVLRVVHHSRHVVSVLQRKSKSVMKIKCVITWIMNEKPSSQNARVLLFFRKQSKKKSGFLTFYRLWTVCSKRAHVSDLKTSKNYVENEVTDPGVACRMRTSPKSNRKAFVDQKCKWVFIILMFHLKKGNKRKMKVVKKIMLCIFRVVYRLGCFSVDDNTLHVMLDWRTSGQRTSLVFLPHLLHVFQEQ